MKKIDKVFRELSSLYEFNRHIQKYKIKRKKAYGESDVPKCRERKKVVLAIGRPRH